MYAGRIARGPFDAWTRSRDGSAAVAAAAQHVRFSLFGKHRVVRRRFWSELANAAPADSFGDYIRREMEKRRHVQ